MVSISKIAISAAFLASYLLFSCGVANAKPFNLTKATSGYLYFNRPGADMIQHDGELKNCIANWSAGYHPGRATLSLGQGVVGDAIGHAVQDVMMSGFERARKNINIEHCMVTKGWRLMRLSTEEGQKLASLTQEELAARLRPYIGSEVPPGETARVWKNEEIYTDTVIVSSPRNAHRQLLSVEAMSPDNHEVKTLQSYDGEIGDIIKPWDASMKRNVPMPLDRTTKPGPGQALLIYTLRLPKKTKSSLFYLERARSSSEQSVDYFGLFARKEFVSLPDGSVVATVAVLVPSGKWFVQGVWLNIDNCMGAPVFEAESGATIYLGTFDTRNAKVKVDTGSAALSASLAGRELMATPAHWINGFTYPCRPMSMYALEFEGFPFATDYKWGSRAQPGE